MIFSIPDMKVLKKNIIETLILKERQGLKF